MTVPSNDEVDARVAAIQAREADGSMELFGAPHESPIELVPADLNWPARFAAVRSQLAAALGPTAVRIEHVGSTSVPGLDAKSVIDVQIGVVDLADEAAYAPEIAALGWPLRLRDSDHRFFREPAGIPRTTHVHVCALGGRWERDHLLFRDYLRSHPDRAAAYADLKWALVGRYAGVRLAYTEAKGPFIEETLRLANAWAAHQDWRP
jgi:GrpB-like predicted nucleotidyltransferase (UPF0157 family)